MNALYISRNKREGLYVGVKAGQHTRDKMLHVKEGISLILCRKPAAPTALCVRNYRDGVWK